MMQLIEFFKLQKYEVNFATPAAQSEFSYPLEKIGVKTSIIELNDSRFDKFIAELNPGIVVFDRFMMEEQFGWRVQENCPEAITILDTEDLHSLRKQRKAEFNGKQSAKNKELVLRELASVFRCDITLMIAKYEIAYLLEKGIPQAQLFYLPFMEDIPEKKSFISYNDRNHFLTIGSFLHDPNVDGVRYLKEQIWPLVRKKLPNAEMHVYGSYPNSKVEQLHNIQQGFLIKGRAEDAEEVMRNARVCLSPLRFGAGLKGKFIDAMKCGTPSVTTKIGAEGMHDGDCWPGFISDSPNEIANKAIMLYTREDVWKEKQAFCTKVLSEEFSKEKFHHSFKAILFELNANLTAHRTNNMIGQILKMNTLRSTKYMSKWIEEKNKR